MNTGKQINAMVVVLFVLLISLGAYSVWDPFRAETKDAMSSRSPGVRGEGPRRRTWQKSQSGLAVVGCDMKSDRMPGTPGGTSMWAMGLGKAGRP